MYAVVNQYISHELMSALENFIDLYVYLPVLENRENLENETTFSSRGKVGELEKKKVREFQVREKSGKTGS